MSFFDKQLFKEGIFGKMKFSFSTPKETLKIIHITESGYASLEPSPVHNGWVDNVSQFYRMSWLLVHSLKMQVCKDGVPCQDEQVLVVTSRCYIPLDPFDVLGKDREKLTSLSEIGGMHHDEVMFDTGKAEGQETVQTLIINSSFMFIMFMIIVWVAKNIWIK